MRPPRALRRLPAAALLAGLVCAAAACDRSPATPGEARAPVASSTAGPAGAAPSAGQVEPGAAPAQTDAAGVAAGIRYVERVTGGALPGEALPMIVAIHGLGDQPARFAGLFTGLDVKARIVLPEGLARYGGGFTWFPLESRNLEAAATAEGIRSAASRLVAALRELSSRRPTAGKPIVTGFSQGGALSYAIALHHADCCAAAYPVGGWIPPDLLPTTAPPEAASIEVVALHGEADPLVPLSVTRSAIERLRATDVRIELRAFPDVAHDVPPPMRRELMGLLAGAARRASAPAAAGAK